MDTNCIIESFIVSVFPRIIGENDSCRIYDLYYYYCSYLL